MLKAYACIWSNKSAAEMVINFKNKMSLNRSAADRVGILKRLESRTDDNSQAVLIEMRKLYSSNGKSK